jgi:hypothetical protein
LRRKFWVSRGDPGDHGNKRRPRGCYKHSSAAAPGGCAGAC